MVNKLYYKLKTMRINMRDPFGKAKDRSVTPEGAPTGIKKDRVGSQTGAPSKVLPDDYDTKRIAPKQPGIEIAFPTQADGTILTKLPQNVKPGPTSVPWWRRDVKTVENNQIVAILTVNVPRGRVFRLDRLGHTFHSTQDEFWITYDGKILNDARWSYPLGTAMTNLYQLRVTVSATKQIICYVFNRSGVSRNYEFFLDGWYDIIEFLRGSKTV